MSDTAAVRLEAGDVAGYVVYRKTGDQGTFVKISPQLLPTPELVDGDVASGAVYLYRVVALDQAGNESDPSTEARASIP